MNKGKRNNNKRPIRSDEIIPASSRRNVIDDEDDNSGFEDESPTPVIPFQAPFKSPRWESEMATQSKSTYRPRPSKNVSQLLYAENYHLLPADHPTYENIKVGPSLLPKARYCDITGLAAPYTDPRTGLHFFDVEAYQLILTLSEEEVEKLLALRGASKAIN